MVSLLAAALMGCLLLAAVVAMRRRLAQRQRMLHESEDAIERLRGETARLTEQLNAHQAMSAELKQAICHHVEMFSSLVEQHVTNLAYSPKKFSEAFERAYSKNRPDDSFWTGFRSYANEKYNGIIAQTHEAYPMLSDTDLNFLSLYCCGFSTSVIMACMGFKEAHSAYNKKRRVAEALGFPANLDAYIALFRDSSEG
jgi:hypothetical protein